MKNRVCSNCKNSEHSGLFEFDYNYVSNVLHFPPELLETIEFQKDGASDLVQCASCKIAYIRQDYEVDQRLSDYFINLSQRGVPLSEMNTDQGKLKTWNDKIAGNFNMNNAIFDILRVYARSKRNKPVRNSKIKLLDFGCGWGGVVKIHFML